MTDLKIRNFPRSLPRALEAVARFVPGYLGYASKHDRREEDKRLRAQSFVLPSSSPSAFTSRS